MGPWDKNISSVCPRCDNGIKLVNVFDPGTNTTDYFVPRALLVGGAPDLEGGG